MVWLSRGKGDGGDARDGGEHELVAIDAEDDGGDARAADARAAQAPHLNQSTLRDRRVGMTYGARWKLKRRSGGLSISDMSSNGLANHHRRRLGVKPKQLLTHADCSTLSAAEMDDAVRNTAGVTTRMSLNLDESRTVLAVMRRCRRCWEKSWWRNI
ncbi:hypothetical protein FIBSPDRAFT_935775 [Athelia psychrophila]|uniref:Uncharacterized protein n=1 Tax=Athelia psychrophila TaxID=1759441 RepID=A0A166D9T8_9AGAM|nr:hypothetical protein FIBSPDRAFT_935775 [Fibularhizoctonia sp. CBS 109695]